MEPILVTGAHRTGTTWVGKILAASPSLAYISEPLNVHHSLGVLGVPVQHWYTYICEDNEDQYLTAYKDTLRFRYRTVLAVKNLRSWQDLLKVGRDRLYFFKANLLNRRPLLKDPFAVFSMPWFSRTLNCRLVVTVRHPLAFVSSLKRLGWSFNFQNLLAQPYLMQDHLERYREEMLAVKRADGDIIEQGVLLWKVVYSVVRKYQDEFPDMAIIRHEDLSLNPFQGFSKLFDHLGLEYSGDVKQKVEETSQEENPPELSPGREHAVQLDSLANITNWKRRLTASEIQRITAATEDELFGFYERDEWRTW
ncbi:MAG: sulfotransferase [Anaerolineales bacterium]